MILATLSLLAGIGDILQPLEDAVKWLLERFHDFGLPWAWSIVATTIFVRICLVPLTVKQIHSMQSLQAHAPEMKELQKKYKGDRAKLNEEMMKFYRENNINPAASCLPLLAQLPIFFALFFVLRDFSDNPPEGDLGWLGGFVPSIADKATDHWSGYLLLAIYAGSQVASTYFMSTTMPKAQRIIMMLLPLAFISVVAHFPVGLVLYWMTTNLWTVGQGLVTRRLVPRTPLGPGGPGAKGAAKKPRDDGSGGNGAKTEQPKPKPKPKPAAKQQPQAVRRKKGGARK